MNDTQRDRLVDYDQDKPDGYTEHLAYDYNRQEWVEGEPARRLVISQLEDNLAILSGPEAEDYLTATRRIDDPNPPSSLADARKRIRFRLEQLGEATP